jgi:Fe-S-cluster containining protein
MPPVVATSPGSRISRPIWRKFHPRFLVRAAAHVRAGGHAAIVQVDENVDVLLSVDALGQITELGLWALLSIEQERWRRVKEGPAEGLPTARVSARYAGAVLDWCERDSVHEGATREVLLDCTSCAACCHDANVLLDGGDLARWRRAGRKDLAGRNYVRRARDGKITLRFAESGRCQHLQGDRRCGIYELRPDNCRAFVEGSEACLSAREETIGIRDGAVAAG